MQSIKENDTITLINVIDQNLKNQKLPKINRDKMDEILVEEFFMVLLPLINYVVFKDKWAVHFKIDKKIVRKNFQLSFNRFLNKAYLPSRKM